MPHRSSLLRLFFLIIISFTLSFAENGKFKIAVITPETGEVANLGEYMRNGINLALSELSASERDKLEITFEDDGFDPKRTISAYNKIKTTAGINAALVLASPPANALVPITEKDKNILFAIAASDPTIAVGREYSFIHWVIPPVLGEKLAKELVKRNLNRVALVVSQATGAIADADALQNELTKLNKGEILTLREEFIMSDKDFRPFILKCKQQNIEAVVSVLLPGQLSNFAKQFRQLNLKAELVGMETFEDQAEVKASDNALVGGWFVNASNYSKEFIEKYQKSYKSYPGIGSGNAFDTIKLLATAVSLYGNDNKKVADYLKNIKDYNGAVGNYSASGDNRFTLPASLKIVKTDGFEVFVN